MNLHVYKLTNLYMFTYVPSHTLRPWITCKARDDEETDEEESEEEEAPQTKPSLKRPAAWHDSSDSDEKASDEEVSRDKNVAIWFRNHQGSLSKD